MTSVIVDTSIAVKWFHAPGEDEVAVSRLLYDAHRSGVVTAHLLDLGIYELGNVMIRSLRRAAVDVADSIEDLLVVFGPVLSPAPAWYRSAAELAEQHRLSFYDAMSAAAARATDSALVSADRTLLHQRLRRLELALRADHPRAALALRLGLPRHRAFHRLGQGHRRRPGR